MQKHIFLCPELTRSNADRIRFFIHYSKRYIKGVPKSGKRRRLNSKVWNRMIPPLEAAFDF